MPRQKLAPAVHWERGSSSGSHPSQFSEPIEETIDRSEALRLLANRVPQAMRYVSEGFTSFASEIGRINSEFLRSRDYVERLSERGFEQRDRANIRQLVETRAVQDLLDVVVPADALTNSQQFIEKQSLLRQEFSEIETRVRTSLASDYKFARIGSLLEANDSVLTVLGLDSTTPANSRALQPFIESVASSKGLSDDIRLMALCRMPGSPGR